MTDLLLGTSLDREQRDYLAKPLRVEDLEGALCRAVDQEVGGEPLIDRRSSTS